MEDIIIKQRLIGQGAYGKIYTAFSRYDDHCLLAVKSSPSSSLRWEEVIFRCLQDCPDVVRCFGGYSSMEVEGSMIYNLVLEYAPGGSLKNLMQRRGGQLSESEVGVYTKMILRGLCYMHRMGLVHCDVKPDNVLVFPGEDGGNVVKMADFGLSRVIGMEEVVGFRCRGTPAYMSPESFALPEYKAPMDIWALGCTIIEMITGKMVWANIKGVPETIEQVVTRKNVPEIPQHMSAYGKDFLGKCFERDPKKRWTAEMLMTHPFITPLPTAPTPIDQMPFSYYPVMTSTAGQEVLEIASRSSNSSMGRSLTELLPPHLLSSSSAAAYYSSSSSSEQPCIPHSLQPHPGHNRHERPTCAHNLIGLMRGLISRPLALIPGLTGLSLDRRR